MRSSSKLTPPLDFAPYCASNSVYRSSDERGVILVLTAILIVALTVFLALAVDSSRATLESVQQKGVADQLALGALEAYTNAPGSPEEKYEVAINRVAELGGANKSVVRNGAKFIEGKASIDDGQNATVTSEKRWFSAPEQCDLPGTCPCGGAPEAVTPCTQACPNGRCQPVNAQDNEFANSFTVRLQTADTAPVMNYFAGAFGGATTQPVSVSSSSTQARTGIVSPKVTTIIVDLSQRTTSESYRPAKRDPSPTEPLDSVYLLGTEKCPEKIKGSSFDPWPDPNFVGLGPIANILVTEVPKENGSGPISSHWRGLPPSVRGRYECMEVNTNITMPGFQKDYAMLYDPDAPEPEPYRSILEATHAALLEFKKNASNLDRIQLIVGWTYVAESLIRPSDAYFSNILSKFDPKLDYYLRLTQTDDDPFFSKAQAKKLRMNEIFRPNTASTSPAGIFTPVVLGSYYMLQLPNSKIADKSILLITQGIPECFNLTSIDCSNLSFAWSCLGYPQKGNTIESILYWWGMEAALDNLTGQCISDSLEKLGIRVHVALVGRNVRPHTLLIRSPDDSNGPRCATDMEKRVRNYYDVLNDDGFTNYQSYNTLGDVLPSDIDQTQFKPFTAPNFFFYRLARMSRGLWIPIRPACPSLPPGITSFDQVCASGEVPPDYLTDPAESLSYIVKSPELISAGIQDDKGRLICDPSLNSPGAQMGAAMNQLLGKSSYVLTN